MRISDWSSDVCSSDLGRFAGTALPGCAAGAGCRAGTGTGVGAAGGGGRNTDCTVMNWLVSQRVGAEKAYALAKMQRKPKKHTEARWKRLTVRIIPCLKSVRMNSERQEENTLELQYIMRNY